MDRHDNAVVEAVLSQFKITCIPVDQLKVDWDLTN